MIGGKTGGMNGGVVVVDDVGHGGNTIDAPSHGSHSPSGGFCGHVIDHGYCDGRNPSGESHTSPPPAVNGIQSND